MSPASAAFVVRVSQNSSGVICPFTNCTRLVPNTLVATESGIIVFTLGTIFVSDVSNSACCFTNGGTDEERECAEAFLAFIYSKDELETFALTEGCQIPNLTYSDEFLSKLDEKPLVKQQTELLTSDTNIVPNVSKIMPESVSNSVFGTNLVQLVNGQITPKEFCEILTTKAAEAGDK